MSKKLIANIIHTLLIMALAVVVWVKVHWSVALFCIWLALSVYVIVSMQIRMYRDVLMKLKALRDQNKQTIKEFNAFVETIGKPAPTAVNNPPPVVPLDSLPKEFKPCQLCVTEGNKTTEFKQGNCPIHN